MWDHIFCICLYLPINTTARNIDWRLHFHGHIKGLKPVQMPGYKCTPSTPGQIYASCVQHYTAVLSWLWAWSNWQLTSILCPKIGLKVKAMLAPSVMMANVGRRLMSTHSRLVVSVFGSKKSLHWKADIGSQKTEMIFWTQKPGEVPCCWSGLRPRLACCRADGGSWQEEAAGGCCCGDSHPCSPANLLTITTIVLSKVSLASSSKSSAIFIISSSDSSFPLCSSLGRPSNDGR